MYNDRKHRSAPCLDLDGTPVVSEGFIHIFKIMLPIGALMWVILILAAIGILALLGVHLPTIHDVIVYLMGVRL